MASYTPDPSNVNQPADTDDISVGAAELRALKAALAGVLSGGMSGANQYRKNLLDNGTGRIFQRAVPASVNGAYGPDRWQVIYTLGAGGAVSLGQGANGGVSNYGAYHFFGFTNVAQVTLAAGDYAALSQRIEGFTFQAAKWGSATAKPITVSFSAAPGIQGPSIVSVALRNIDATRSYVHPVNILAGKNSYSFTVPGDILGTWTIDNAPAIELVFTFGCGSTYTAPAANTWYAGNYLAAPGTTNIVGTLNGSISISDVQLEIGSAPTQFEVIDYGSELLRCQRFYERSNIAAGVCNSAGGDYAITLIPKHRVPTATMINGGTFVDGFTTYAITSAALINATFNSARVQVGASGTTPGRAFVTNNDHVMEFIADF